MSTPYARDPRRKAKEKDKDRDRDRNSSSNTPVETAPSITPQGAPPARQRCPMPSMWEDWTLESEVPLQGQTVLLWTTRTLTQQGRQVQTETDPQHWNQR